MLRIAPDKPMTSPEQEVVDGDESVMPEATEVIPEDMSMAGGGQVDPAVARYFTGEYMCNNCIHFMDGADQGRCEIVAGPIDPEGICSLYSPDSDGEATNEPDELIEDKSTERDAEM